MKKTILSLALLSLLTSCVVSTAAKVVKTAGKVAVGTVKTAVKGVGWTINKASGKIDEDRLNGTWKVTGIYEGTFEQFAAKSEPENLFDCAAGEETYQFKVKKGQFLFTACGSADAEKFKYKYSFEKDHTTGDRENMITYGPSYFNIIDVTGKNLALEGYFLNQNGTKVRSICTLEKVK